MMSEQPVGLAKWHKFVSENDRQSLTEALADDVLFRSPVLWRPKEGKTSAMLYLSSAAHVLEDFTYQRQFVGDSAVVLEFSVHIGQLSVKGVDIIQFNAEGQIVDFEVMVRPAKNISELAIFAAGSKKYLVERLPVIITTVCTAISKNSVLLEGRQELWILSTFAWSQFMG
jgi:hypothetical protein